MSCDSLFQIDMDQPLSRPTRDVQAASKASSAESPLNNRFLMRPTREVKPVNNDFLMRPTREVKPVNNDFLMRPM